MARPSPRRSSKLQSGRHGLAPEEVAANQRERLFAAMVAVVAERGYAEARVVDVIERSEISRRTFYELFLNKDECFLAAFDRLVEDAREVASAAATGAASWRERLHAGLEALLAHFAAHPDAARVVLVEVLAGGPTAVQRYDEALRPLIPFLDEGRELSPYAEELPPNLSEALLGGMVQMAYLRVVSGETASLPDALEDLEFFVLVPYLGHRRAASRH